MRFRVVHQSSGRVRVRAVQPNMTLEQADLLEAWLQTVPGVIQAQVHERTCCAIVRFHGAQEDILAALRAFSYEDPAVRLLAPLHSSRALKRAYEEKLVGMVAFKVIRSCFFPAPLRALYTVCRSVPYLFRAVRCLVRRQLRVELLDGLSVGLSMLRRDFGTAGSVMFLLGLGELLEEWTHKKSVDDLARCMSLNVDRVWLNTPGGDVLVPLSQVSTGDLVRVRMGSVIPVDGIIQTGEIMVNQASLTGESVPVPKAPGMTVYAGTVAEEGECLLAVGRQSGESRYDKIVAMIEQSEKLKSAAESKAAGLADRLVPYTLAGSALTWLLTRNTARAASVLMVDFSCALKLAMPLAVLSAMREAGSSHVTIKGGKYLEAVAKADTIVFDKTGTLTRACPTVAQIVPFGGHSEADMLRLAACLEEHFPHSMANAVVQAARDRGLSHEEMHSRVEYIVAHGIASTVGQERVLVGSAHFIFEELFHLRAIEQGVDESAVHQLFGFNGNQQCIGQVVQLLDRQVAVFRQLFQQVVPDGSHVGDGLFAVGVAHSGVDIGFDGRLVGSYLQDLHLDAQFVVQTFPEHHLPGQTSEIDSPHGVQHHAVGGGTQQVFPLRVGVGIGVDKFAALLEVDQCAVYAVECGDSHVHAVGIDVDAVDMAAGLGRRDGFEYVVESVALFLIPHQETHYVFLAAFGHRAQVEFQYRVRLGYIFGFGSCNHAG